MKTYSEMELNVAQDHRDPSDHMTCLIFSFLALESAKLPTFPDTAKLFRGKVKKCGKKDIEGGMTLL